MIGECMKIGDEVIITSLENVPKKALKSLGNIKAEIVGFPEICFGRLNQLRIKPGVYANKDEVIIRLENGEEITEESFRVSLLNRFEYNQRVIRFRKIQLENPGLLKKEFIRDLPETPFWESDKVRAREGYTVVTSYEKTSELDPKIYTVIGIDYRLLFKKTMAETDFSPYHISNKINFGWVNEKEIKLVERGPVWKFYHNEPPSFENIKEEADFFETLGHTEEIQNPYNGLFEWTEKEIIEAIKRGIVHGYYPSKGFLGGKPLFHAKRFFNKELGRRLAKATLENLLGLSKNNRN